MKTRIDADLSTRLLLLLLGKGLLSGEQVASCQMHADGAIESYLCKQGWISRNQIIDVLSESFGLPALSPDIEPLEGALSNELAIKHQVLPIELRENSLIVAVIGPPSSEVTIELAQAFQGTIHYAILDRLSLEEKLDQLTAAPQTKELEQDDHTLKGQDHGAKPHEATRETTQPTMVNAQEAPTSVARPPAKVMPTIARKNETPMRPLIGGRYKLGERFLDGRFSILYHGLDQRTGLPVAIRHLEGYFSSEDARTQTLREGRTLAKLRHSNLPRIRHLVVEDDDVFLIADELAGRTLAQVIESDGAFHPELVRRYLIQLLQVVDYLHSQPQPIIHRDLRPTSIIVTTHGNLRLAEFGLAKMGEAATGASVTSFRSAGDPNFAAPEQLLGDASSVKNDLYSVGALAYYLALGQPPAPSLRRLSGAVAMAPLPPSFDHHVVDVVRQCLAPKPEDRCDSAKELLSRLQTTEVRLPLLFESQDDLLPATASGGKPEDVTPQEVPSATESSEAKASGSPESSVPKPKADTTEPTQRPSKRSMWQLLFGKKKAVEVSDAGLGQSFQDQLQSFPTANLAAMDLDRNLCRTLPESFCHNISGICIGKLSDTNVTIACKDPTDVYIHDQLALVSGGRYKATLMRADHTMIDHALEWIYKGEHLGPETTWSKFLEQKRLDGLSMETMNEQAHISFGDEALEGPVVSAVDRLIKEAISAEASDIHLEPFDTGMTIRYRIDGVLRAVSHYNRSEASPIIKRIKVLANMDIAQERVTQGGRISLKIGSQEFDLRVSVVPVPAGESIVMRVLKKGAFTLTLADLGFPSETEARFRRILSQPHGMILVCGPTGSGKSTTLYASLKEIARPDRKLLTAEDPIEYQMPGIIQVQMNMAPKEEEKRVTFSKTLREFLRQDPDVILVGEIRDQETAEIGIQAALTGHLLLSTLHTNDSIGIIARLRDMGCEPFQIGSVLLGGLAQRLARRICQECKEEIKIEPEFLPLFASRGVENPRSFRGKGCRRCHQSGYRGRLGVYELLEITPELRSLINRSALEEEIKAQAFQQGFHDLLADGLHKVKAGLISLEEILRVCKTL